MLDTLNKPKILNLTETKAHQDLNTMMVSNVFSIKECASINQESSSVPQSQMDRSTSRFEKRNNSSTNSIPNFSTSDAQNIDKNTTTNSGDKSPNTKTKKRQKTLKNRKSGN